MNYRPSPKPFGRKHVRGTNIEPNHALTMKPLQRTEDLEEALALAEKKPVLLFKHSATCSISLRAHREMEQLTGAQDPAVYLATVQRARNLSNAIAEQFGIRHESPQVILLVNGKPVFHTSHFDVTAAQVRAALSQTSMVA